MKIIYIILLAILFSCNEKPKDKNKALETEKEAAIESAVHTIETTAKDTIENITENNTIAFKEIIDRLAFKKLPVIDTTNFDNFNEEKFLNQEEAKALSLEEIYPDFYKEGYNYRATPSYKIDFSKDFHSIVIVVFKGDNEMESILINYTTTGSIINHKVVSYDEIAEGWSKIVSRIGDRIITTNHIFYGEEAQVNQIEHIIYPDGKIVKTDEKSLNETIDNFSFLFEVLNVYGGNESIIKVKTDFLTSKVVPNRKEETIIVIPEIATYESADEFDLDCHILIANTTTGKVTQAIFESAKNNQWVSDALRLNKIEIDTAPYMLSGDERAFGIRTFYIGSSRVNPYNSETLSLFVKYDSAFKKVLDNYTVSDYNGEWDGTCTGEFIDHKRTLIMSEEKTNGYFDIIIKNKITKSVSSEDENGDCDTKETTNTATSLLKFDGVTYKP